jgi:uncharacterized protein
MTSIKKMNQHARNNFIERYGPWAVVTGASSGIGRALAIKLAEAGLNLVIVARREKELAQLATELMRRPLVQCRVVVADLASADGVEAVESGTRDIDVGLLVAAAGFGTAGSALAASLDDELSMLELNCRAVLKLGLHFGRRLAQRRRGGMILFCSLVGYQGAPRAAHYAATKAYVHTLAEGWHVELAPLGVNVLCAAPGPVRSGFGQRARMNMGAADTPEVVARGTLKALGRRMTVTPGPISKLLTWSLMTAPRSLRVRIMAKIMGGMTKRLA